MKQVWKEETKWDEKVSVDVLKQWNEYKVDLQSVGNIEFPQIPGDVEVNKNYEINIFCDASKEVFGF